MLLSPALAAIIYGLAQVGTLGGFGHATVAVPLALGVALLGAFVVHALRARTEAVVDLRLFRVRSFASASALLFLSGLSMYGAMLLLPLYYQQVRGQGVVAAGLLLAPQGLGSLLTRGPLGTLIDRIGSRPVILAGTVLTALGTVAYTQAGPHTSELLLAVSLVVRGAGLSGATMAVMAAAYRDLAPADIPHASSATRILQQVGGSFGAAVLAVVLPAEARRAQRGHGVRRRVLVVAGLHRARRPPRTADAARTTARRRLRPEGQDSNMITSRPRTPPASRARCASPAPSGG